MSTSLSHDNDGIVGKMKQAIVHHNYILAINTPAVRDDTQPALKPSGSRYIPRDSKPSATRHSGPSRRHHLCTSPKTAIMVDNTIPNLVETAPPSGPENQDSPGGACKIDLSTIRRAVMAPSPAGDSIRDRSNQFERHFRGIAGVPSACHLSCFPACAGWIGLRARELIAGPNKGGRMFVHAR